MKAAGAQQTRGGGAPRRGRRTPGPGQLNKRVAVVHGCPHRDTAAEPRPLVALYDIALYDIIRCTILFMMLYTLYAIHCTQYAICHTTLYYTILHYTILQCQRNTLNAISHYTLYTICYMLYAICYMLYTLSLYIHYYIHYTIPYCV